MRLRQIEQVQSAGKSCDRNRSALVPIGSLCYGILVNWRGAVSLDVVFTNERYRHCQENHPDISEYDNLVGDVVMAPDEVHRDRKDPQVAILYKQLDAGEYLRIALWISNTPELQNSLLSFRRARRREVRSGRKQGKLVWEQQ